MEFDPAPSVLIVSAGAPAPPPAAPPRPASAADPIDAGLAALASQARDVYRSTLAIRGQFHGLALDMLARGDEPVIVRSWMVGTIAQFLPRLDVPGSLDERHADAYLGAVDDAIAGRPPGPCDVDLYAADDFMDPDSGPEFLVVAEVIARHANESGRAALVAP